MGDSTERFSASYAAFFAPRTHNFETVDFRVPKSPANLRTYFATTNVQRRTNARIAGLLGVLIGVAVAILAFGVDQLTRGLTLAVYTATAAIFRSVNDNGSGRYWLALLVFVVITLVYVVAAAVMVVYVAPLGAGSGIPELKSYLNGVRIPSFLAVNTLVVKAFGVAFSIASGLICGKQGPMIHAGAIMGAGLSQAASTRFRFRSRLRIFRFLRTEAWKRDFTAVGAAVGVAVAFGSPMGAWMWVYEEACTHWTWSLGIITLGACLTGSVVVRILNYLASGLPGDGFGAFTLTQFGKLVIPFDGHSFLLKDIPAFVLLGVVGGICGALLPLINKYITLFRYKRITRPVPRIFEVALISVLTSFIRLLIPYLAHDCRPVNDEIQQVLSNAPLQDFSRFICSADEYSGWAAVMYNPTDSVVRALLHTKERVFPAGALAVSFVYYFLFIIWTYGTAVPAGVFFPGFLLGSVYGRLIGIAVHSIFPGRDDLSLTGYAFLGAVSALAGLTRTISVAVIALEATGSGEASFGAVFVALIAKLVGDFLYTNGIYDLHITLKGIPFLSSNVPNLENYLKHRVRDVMSSQVIAVRRLSRVSELMRMLATNDHHAFPVFIKTIPTNGAGWSRSGTQSGQSFLEEEELMVEGRLLSGNSVLEAVLEEKESPSFQKVLKSSSIITANHIGMQAMIFDDGQIRLVQLNDKGESKVTFTGTRMTPKAAGGGVFSPHSKLPGTKSDSATTPSSLLDSSGGGRDEAKVRDFELMGAIDRGTLLALLKYECDKAKRKSDGEKVDDAAPIPREQLDSAWPNPARLKGDLERELVQQVKGCGVDNNVIDIKQYIDPNPLVMFDRAHCNAAYHMFRKSGARHILVANARLGQIVGIVTRKDILEESIEDVLNAMREIEVE